MEEKEEEEEEKIIRLEEKGVGGRKSDTAAETVIHKGEARL